MTLPLADKSAIVTGAAGGLGKAIAEKFLKAGARVTICDINEERLKSASEELSTHGQVHSIRADITDEKSVKEIFEDTIEKFGAVDILVNNAGIMDRFDAVGTLDKALWDKVLAINLSAPMMMSKWAVNHMTERNGGVILNIGSMAGQFGFRAGAAYTSSKHGLIGLTKNTAAFYGTKGIRCNLIMPGGMQTNIQDAFQAGMNNDGFQVLSLTAAMQPPTSDVTEMADLALFLCSDSSKVMNGACVNADKGWSAY